MKSMPLEKSEWIESQGFNWKSGSGIEGNLSKILTSIQLNKNVLLKASSIETPIGSMLAIADDKVLYLLEFIDRQGLERELMQLKKKMHAGIMIGYCLPLESIKHELQQYFKGSLKEFKTPISYFGSSFQQLVWEQLRKIPFGGTCSYSELAHLLEKPTACRAVAKANSTNQLAIIIPCHRVINKNGDLGGYAGGIDRKKWLIDHEKKLNFS